MKIALTAVVTAALCFGIMATTGSSARRGSSYDLVPGDTVAIANFDLTCSYLHATRRNTQPTFLCSRPGTGASLGLTITADWIRVWTFPASSSAQCCKTLLFAHRRNP